MLHTRETLTAAYAALVATVAKMRDAQNDYWAGKARGYNAPHKLHKAIRLEKEAQVMYKDKIKLQVVFPLVYEPVAKEYAHFMVWVRDLLSWQAQYFKTKDAKILQKAKLAETEVDKLIKEYRTTAKSEQLQIF